MANGNKKSKMTTEEKVVPLPIAKAKSVFERFKSRKSPTISGVSELPTQLSIMKISDVDDWVRLSPHEDHWSPEMCFVNVPVHGEKRDLLHFIDEDIAMKYLSAKRIKRFRLVLASKPYDVFFFAIVPTINLDNSWNSSMLAAVEQAKTLWVQAVSLKVQGKECYKTDFAEDQDAFPEPAWPDDVDALLRASFPGRTIEEESHPALARLLGRKPDLK